MVRLPSPQKKIESSRAIYTEGLNQLALIKQLHWRLLRILLASLIRTEQKPKGITPRLGLSVRKPYKKIETQHLK